MKKKRNKRKIPYQSGCHIFKVPDCYEKNPKLWATRIRKEEAKKKKEESDFFEWYNKELKKYGYK